MINIKEIIERFEQAYEAERENFEKASDDLKFVASDDQWSEDDKNARKGRPCLTINKVAHYQDIIEGDYRQNRPSIKVVPVDDAADPQVAEIYTGIIRNIENQSVAKIAYTNCFSPMAGGGIGNIRVATRYVSDDSFDQEIFIEPVENPFSVLYDPNAKRYDRQDGDYIFVFADITKDEFRRRFPNARVIDFDNADSLIKKNNWVQQDMIRIAEYFKKEYSEYTLYEFEDGTTGFDKDGGTVKRQRTVRKYRIMRHLVSAIEELEDAKEWPSRFFPNIPAYGKVTNIKGERKVRGAIRFSKDPQRAYNYWRSATTEQVALAPKSPYMLTPKMIAGHEAMWDTAHTENKPYLLYNADTKAPTGKPVKEPPAPIPIGAANEVAMADDEIRDTMNVNLAKAGFASNERSGKAIAERRRGSDTANFTYLDNMAWTTEAVGRVIVDLIPKIYDTERIVRILYEDGKSDRAVLKRTGTAVIEDAIGKIYDPNVGKYDVVVTIGPSYTTQRQEAADNMYSIMQTSPDIAKMVADLLFQYQDFPGADKIAERLRKALPPQILDEDGKIDGAVPREQVEAAIMQGIEQGVVQYQQGIEAQQAQVKLAQEQTKLQGLKIENEIKQAELAATEEKIKQKVSEMLKNGEL